MNHNFKLNFQSFSCKDVHNMTSLYVQSWLISSNVKSRSFQVAETCPKYDVPLCLDRVKSSPFNKLNLTLYSFYYPIHITITIKIRQLAKWTKNIYLLSVRTEYLVLGQVSTIQVFVPVFQEDFFKDKFS